MKFHAFAAAALFAATQSATAQVAASGNFVPREICPATRSTHAGPGADDVPLEIGHSYKIVGKNRPEATYYLIEVEGADPRRRWVAADCATHEAGPGAPPDAGTRPKRGAGASNLLSVSWQPAFCETHADKPECAAETPDGFDATHFTLHGLWPQPRSQSYCGVAEEYVSADKDHDWASLPPVALSAPTRASLTEVMPGVASQLERHEWIEHGTCFTETRSQDQYFARAVSLITQLNGSAVRDLFASNRGATITAGQIRKAFDDSFGAGAGERVFIACSRNRGGLITEMRINLVGDVGDAPSLAALIAAAAPAKEGCPAGIVDQVR